MRTFRRYLAERSLDESESLPANAEAILNKKVPAKLRRVLGIGVGALFESDQPSDKAWTGAFHLTNTEHPQAREHGVTASVFRVGGEWLVLVVWRGPRVRGKIAEARGKTVNDALNALELSPQEQARRKAEQTYEAFISLNIETDYSTMGRVRRKWSQTYDRRAVAVRELERKMREMRKKAKSAAYRKKLSGLVLRGDGAQIARFSAGRGGKLVRDVNEEPPFWWE